MSVFTKTPRLARFRSRLLALFCIALTLSFGASAAVSASESAHHELEVARQTTSSAGTIICLGNDRSCGLPDHDENDVVPHLHTCDIGLVGLPAVDAPTPVHYL